MEFWTILLFYEHITPPLHGWAHSLHVVGIHVAFSPYSWLHIMALLWVVAKPKSPWLVSTACQQNHNALFMTLFSTSKYIHNMYYTSWHVVMWLLLMVISYYILSINLNGFPKPGLENGLNSGLNIKCNDCYNAAVTWYSGCWGLRLFNSLRLHAISHGSCLV